MNNNISGLTVVHKAALDEFFNELDMGTPEYICCPSGNMVIFKIDNDYEEKMERVISSQPETGYKYSIYEMKFGKIKRPGNRKSETGQSEYSCRFLMLNRRTGYGNERRKKKKL